MVLPYGEIGSRALNYASQLYANIAGANGEYTGKFSLGPVILATTLALSLWILRQRRK
jgi:hypothetical protein